MENRGSCLVSSNTWNWVLEYTQTYIHKYTPRNISAQTHGTVYLNTHCFHMYLCICYAQVEILYKLQFVQVRLYKLQLV